MQHLGSTSFECSYAVSLMRQQFELVFCKACFARFFTFSSKLQIYVLLHIVTMNGHGWIFLLDFAVVLVDEILEDDISHLYMALSNRTHLDIPNQRDNTSLHQDNDSSKLISYCKQKIKLFKLNNTPLFISQFFWWLRKSYIWIVNRLKKYSCIVCTAFPLSLNKCKLHVRATCCHYILSGYIFSTNKWYLIFLWYTNTYMCSINRSNTILQKKKKFTDQFKCTTNICL